MSNKLKGSRSQPLNGYLTERKRAGGSHSTKSCFMLTLATEGDHLDYEPGDTAAIFPHNPLAEVDRFFKCAALDPESSINDPRSGATLSWRGFLTTKINIQNPSLALLKLALPHHPELAPLLEADAIAQLKEWLSHRDLIQFLEQYPFPLDPLLFAKALPPLLPRFYSITTSPLHFPDRIGMLINCFHKKIGAEEKVGVASHYLCEQALLEKCPISFYIQPNPHFRPPTPEIPLIMIGPGTGVAPFRAFMQQRSAQKAPMNWLFFGERQSEHDFYYQSEWEEYVQRGELKLSTAFSRDSSDKLYVQHRMAEEKQLLWHWMEQNAHVFICGDALHMAKDVTTTLMEIAMSEGSMSESEAISWLKSLRVSGRLKLDVY